MDKKNNILISVFTATYNRADLLPRLFDSLIKQSSKDFEWIIVDDGSEDNTEQVVSTFINNSSININYHKQKNQGKHIAINKGLELANGLLFYIVDSDDRLPESSIEIITSKFNRIKDLDTCAGLVGLKCYFNGKTVGTPALKNEMICSNFEYRHNLKVIGDRAEVLKLEIFKKYPFPKFRDENFIPESIVWNRIAKKYDMLFFNENIYECEYLEDGLSANSVALRRRNPIGIIHLYAELSEVSKIGSKERLKANINFWRFNFCTKRSFITNIRLLKKKTAILLMPIGLLFFLKDSLYLLTKRNP